MIDDFYQNWKCEAEYKASCEQSRPLGAIIFMWVCEDYDLKFDLMSNATALKN